MKFSKRRRETKSSNAVIRVRTEKIKLSDGTTLDILCYYIEDEQTDPASGAGKTGEKIE